MDVIHTPDNERLFEVILKLKTLDDCYRFFEDIMTLKELESISQRWKVAEMLAAEKSYQEICRETGASTATISRVNRCLLQGSGGYRNMLGQMKEEDA